MKELVFLLEEESARAMLEGLLPRILPAGVHPRFIPFEGKQDLEKQLVKKLRGYLNPHACFIILRDQDSHHDCIALKERLLDLCRKAGRQNVLIRIACREMESFYLADLAAVESGLGLSRLQGLQNTRKFRAPDYLGSPSHELTVLTKGKYQKVGGSRAIAPYLDIDNARSASFRALVTGIIRVASAPEGTCA